MYEHMSNRSGHPVGGVDYPRTLQKFDTWFSSEEACSTYLAQLPWPSGFICLACGGATAWTTARGLYQCADCQRQVSVTASTNFEGTRKPLRVWFQAIT